MSKQKGSRKEDVWVLRLDEQGRLGAKPRPLEQGVLKNPLYLSLGSFVVSLADRRQRYLKIKIELIITRRDAHDYLKGRLGEVKDTSLGILQLQTAEKLRDARERAGVKARILREITALLPPEMRKAKNPPALEKVLFTEFYMQ